MSYTTPHWVYIVRHPPMPSVNSARARVASPSDQVCDHRNIVQTFPAKKRATYYSRKKRVILRASSPILAV